MKTRKVLFCLSAISLTLYSVWEVIRQTPVLDTWYSEHIWGNPLRVEIYWLPYTWLYLGAVLLALVASLCSVREAAQPVNRLYKHSTIALSIMSLFVTLWGIIHAVQIYGFGFLYVPTWVRIVLAVAGCAWLWLIVFRPANQQLPKSLRSLIWLGIGLIALIWILQLASGISYLTTGHILMFRTHAFGNWLRYLIPTILLCSYSLFLLDKWPSVKLVQLHQTRNSHCTPGSDMERIYPAMRVLAFVLMGLTFVAFYCMMMWMNCFIFHDYAIVAGRAMAIFVFITWLLLTFMAFFQLPNPRGYKVFNWIFLVLNLCLPIGLVLSILFERYANVETIGELFGLTGLFAVTIYLLWTFIRVVLYKMPESEVNRNMDVNLIKKEPEIETNEPILLESKNYKSYLPIDIAAFSWAFGGAMGDAGGVDIVSKSGESYYFNWVRGDLSEDQINEILPIIHECELPIFGETDSVPQGWRHISLGCGNNLLIKEEYVEPLRLAWENFKLSLEEGKYVILYNVWQQLITDIVKKQ